MGQRNIIVVYKSSTGFTKRYAEMIADELKCAIADYKTVTADVLAKYDVVIFGTRAHAGMIDGYQKARKLFEKSNVKKVILFVTGATPNAAADVVDKFWSQNLTAGELSKLPHFYMQSGLCYERMSLVDRLMMKVAAVMIKHKKNKTAEDAGFEQAIKRSFDISSRAYIKPLTDYLGQFLNL